MVATTNYTDVEIAFAGDLQHTGTGKFVHVVVETFRDPKARKGQPWGFRIAWGNEAPWEYHRRYNVQAHAVRTARRVIRNRRTHGQFIGRPKESGESKAAS